MNDETHHQQRSYNNMYNKEVSKWVTPFGWIYQHSWQTGSQVGGVWIAKAIQGPTTYMITDGKRDRTIHISRLRKQVQPAPILSESSDDTPMRLYGIHQ